MLTFFSRRLEVGSDHFLQNEKSDYCKEKLKLQQAITTGIVCFKLPQSIVQWYSVIVYKE